MEESLIDTLRQSKILITGASGWIGKNAIQFLMEVFESRFRDSVLATASSNRTEMLRNSCHFEVFKQNFNLVRQFEPNIVINLGFATRDFEKIYGVDKYLAINRYLNESFKEILALPSVEFVLSTSSGAVESANNPNSNLNDPYVVTKLEQEQILREERSRNTIAALDLRVWSISGEYIKQGSGLVLEEFISKALKGEDIIISSPDIQRSYIDAYEMSQLALLALLTTEHELIHSGGEVVSLRLLAETIVEVLKSKSSITIDKQNLETGFNYVSLQPNLSDLATEFNIETSDLRKQIITTANYLRDCE